MSDERERLLRIMLDRLGVLDFDAVELLLTEDAAFETPFRDGPRVTQGRNAIMALLRGSMIPFFTRMNFEIRALYPSEDPAFLVAEYVSDCDTTTGGKYANRYITLVEVRDGRIKLFREYYSPLARAAAT